VESPPSSHSTTSEPRALAAGAHTLYIGTTTGSYAMDLNTRAVRTITSGADYSGGIALESGTLPFGLGSADWNSADSGSATVGLPNPQC
jgi:hypothetical protein